MGYGALLLCVTGSKALIANDIIRYELNTPDGEWQSDVFKSTGDTSTACFVFDLKLEKFAKRINVELIYQDVNNAVQKVSLFDYYIATKDLSLKGHIEQFGTLEFYLKHVLQYQVCIGWAKNKLFLEVCDSRIR